MALCVHVSGLTLETLLNFAALGDMGFHTVSGGMPSNAMTRHMAGLVRLSRHTTILSALRRPLLGATLALFDVQKVL